MKRANDFKSSVILAVIGIVPVIWLALLIAPYADGGLVAMLSEFPKLMKHPLHIQWCSDSPRVIGVCLLAYGMAIGIYFSSRRNYRRGEKHGSAKWGSASALNKKYRDRHEFQNKILTQNVRIGLDGKKHRRNLNVLVCGGSGAGKTRFYCLPNAMQCNTSFVTLDLKGEIIHKVGLAEKERVSRARPRPAEHEPQSLLQSLCVSPRRQRRAKACYQSLQGDNPKRFANS